MQLGYLGFEVSDVAAWEAFAVGVLGLEVASRTAGGGLALRMDRHEQRIVITPGPADDLVAVGLEMAPAELDERLDRLARAGVPVARGSDEEAAGRRVARLHRLRDPSGIPIELVTGAARAAEPPATARFVADDLGLGHVVLSASDRGESRDFYMDLLGFKLSDQIVADVYGYQADLLFFHCNPRHHTIALGDRQEKRLHHFMLEARTLDEVGLAFDRALAGGARVMHTLGRHPNDRMVSFYATTPSGFQFEYGWGARLIDDAVWTPAVHDRVSEWGHQPPPLLRRRESKGAP
jgi:2,3-dihydroxybiphenyl 1,2-dioxygenase